MYIVFNKNMEKHSGWENIQGAIRQKEVLEKKGYKKLTIHWQGYSNCPDGHYFVD